MTFPLTPSTESLLKQNLHRFAHCWRITRTDGTIIRTTDHDVPLTVGTETFAPASGFTASARQKQAGLAEQNFEVIGVLDSDAITDADLRLGLRRPVGAGRSPAAGLPGARRPLGHRRL